MANGRSYFEILADDAKEGADLSTARGRIACFVKVGRAIHCLPEPEARAAAALTVMKRLGIEPGPVFESFLDVCTHPRPKNPAIAEWEALVEEAHDQLLRSGDDTERQRLSRFLGI